MRKVLSFVLVLALVLSSFSMAFAADSTTTTTAATTGLTDIAGNANEDAIQVNYDLGIITGNPDGTFLPDKAVTRAEFAAMLTRALDIPDSALAGYTTTSFKDTTGYTWAVPYLAFCQSKGILLGDGAGNVMPGRTITVNEAMTMALRAIGYTANSALLVGAWPANYVSIAQNESLYDDVATTTTVNKASAAQIIYNLLTVQKVAVNSDGTTDYLWKDKDNNKASNLLNTNLGCTEDDNVILGQAYDYNDSKINITDSIGAYGDAYLNKDNDLVAFTKHDCTELTGKVDDSGKFEVGDVEYDFGTNAMTTTAAFTNATLDTTTTNTYDGTKIGKTDVDAYASAKADGGDTVTLWANVSGKKIKDIYSVSAWQATSVMLADSSVQDDIADNTLNGSDFDKTDNDAIDMTKFALVGVDSLDKIAKDNVVYVYESKDSDAYIRKVAVGTETVNGAVDEVTLDNDSTSSNLVSTATINGKDYDVSALATSDAQYVDTDSEGLFYLDAYGEIYDFDGTNGTNTYAIVKASEPGDSFNNVKVKLYKSDDSTSTYYLSEDDATKIDWTGTQTTLTSTTASALVAGKLVGYSLNSDGDVDALNVSTSALGTGSVLKSSKVLYDGTKSYKIDPQAVVFTYEGTMGNTSSYDIGSVADIDAGTTIATNASQGAFILNGDGNVTAIFVEASLANLGNNDVYGVLNTRTTAKDDSGDAVYKYTGYIDGTAFAYKTDNQDPDVTWSLTDGRFGVYAFTVDSSNVVTSIKKLDAYDSTGKTSKFLNETSAAEVVQTLDDNHTVITTTTGSKYTVSDDAVVYKYDKNNKTFTVSKLSSIAKSDTVALYDTKDSDYDGVATVVIYIAH